MHWEIIEDGVEVSIITKIDVLWLFMAIIGFLYLVFISVRDSRKMKRQLKLWLESGEQPSQTTFISTEEWTAMLPIQWINLPGWEHFFDLWIRPQLELYRKAKAWAILSILIGSASTIFDLIKAL